MDIPYVVLDVLEDDDTFKTTLTEIEMGRLAQCILQKDLKVKHMLALFDTTRRICVYPLIRDDSGTAIVLAEESHSSESVHRLFGGSIQVERQELRYIVSDMDIDSFVTILMRTIVADMIKTTGLTIHYPNKGTLNTTLLRIMTSLGIYPLDNDSNRWLLNTNHHDLTFKVLYQLDTNRLRIYVPVDASFYATTIHLLPGAEVFQRWKLKSVIRQHELETASPELVQSCFIEDNFNELNVIMNLLKIPPM